MWNVAFTPTVIQSCGTKRSNVDADENGDSSKMPKRSVQTTGSSSSSSGTTKAPKGNDKTHK